MQAMYVQQTKSSLPLLLLLLLLLCVCLCARVSYSQAAPPGKEKLYVGKARLEGIDVGV